MTNRERIRNCAQGKPIDRTPFAFYFGPWGETIEKWKKEEGITSESAWLDGFGFDSSVVCLAQYVNHLFYPVFEPEILDRKGDILTLRDGSGAIIQAVANTAGIPRIIKSPVSSRAEWENLKRERLNPHSPGRFPENWRELAGRIRSQDAPVQIGAYPCGLYGTLRDLMGVEGSLLAFYDDPDLVRDIMNDLTDFWLTIFEKICAEVQVDILHIWEDMSGKQGSLISPGFVREFMLPNYRRFKEFTDKHDIAVFQVDTDGNCEELIPLFHEAGVNMMLPFEVSAGCDVVALRHKYPAMSMMGGIDKREIAKGKEAIDKELRRIKPLINKTGYFPALDHLIDPGIRFADYSYFVRQLKELIFSGPAGIGG